MYLVAQKPPYPLDQIPGILLPTMYVMKEPKAEARAKRKARKAKEAKKAAEEEQKLVNEENAIDKPPVFFR